jgi:hypothetical protein
VRAPSVLGSVPLSIASDNEIIPVGIRVISLETEDDAAPTHPPFQENHAPSLVVIPISDGKTPVRLFPDNLSVAKFHYWTVRARTANEMTMQSYNSPKLESMPNDVGMLPDKVLPKSESNLRFDKCPISVGIVPFNWFDDADKVTDHKRKGISMSMIVTSTADELHMERLVIRTERRRFPKLCWQGRFKPVFFKKEQFCFTSEAVRSGQKQHTSSYQTMINTHASWTPTQSLLVSCPSTYSRTLLNLHHVVQ